MFFRLLTVHIMATLIGILAVACGGEVIPCKSTTECPEGLVCLNEVCEYKRCVVDEQCGVGAVCDTKTKLCKKNPRPAWSCSADGDCRSGEQCLDGRCEAVSKEVCNPPCRDGFVCQNRDCVEETKPCEPECRVGYACENGTCVEVIEEKKCTSDVDCSDGTKCNLLASLCQKTCTDDSSCESGTTCQDGWCQKPTTGCSDTNPCASPKVCVEGSCVEPECHSTKPCQAPKTCKENKCVDISCSASEPCPSGYICDTGRCVEPECSAQKACPSPKVCKDNKCTEPPTTCSASSPCPSGKRCVAGVCVDQNYCAKREDCSNNQPCIQNLCQPCTKDGDCYSFEKCTQGQCTFTEKQLGEQCNNTSECKHGLSCVGDGSGKQYCRELCDPIASPTGCSAGAGCSLLSDKRNGVCLPLRGSSAKKPGDVCDPAQDQCEVDLVCVNDGGRNICMSLCDRRKGVCTSGKKCISVNLDPVGVCEEAGSSTGKGEGQACASKSECQAGMFCLGVAGNGVCTPACDPYAPVCSTGKVCDLLIDYTTKVAEAVCGPVITGLGEGKLCRYQAGSSNCQSNLFCFVNLSNPGTGLCSRPCNPNNPQCPAGMQCLISPLIYKGSNLHGCI